MIIKCKFPIIPEFYDSGDKTLPYKLLGSINPLKQKQVKDLLDCMKGNTDLEKVVLFGSAIRWDCHQDSDIDLAIWTIGDLPFADCHETVDKMDDVLGKYDLLNMRGISEDDTIYKQVQEGLVLYERSQIFG